MTRVKRLVIVVGVLLACVPVPAGTQEKRPATASSVEVWLGEALHREDVAGDKAGAAALYEQVLADPRAMPEHRSKAQARLARLRPPRAEARGAGAGAVAPTATRLFTRAGTNGRYGAPSPDGRYLPVADYTRGGDLWLEDLTAGTSRRVTTGAVVGTASPAEYASHAQFSPDGRRIAYGWKTPHGYQLRLVNADGTDVRTLVANPEHEWIGPAGWSRDQSRILVKVQARSNVGQLAWVRVDDGTLQTMKSLPWTALGDVAVSPGGDQIAYDGRTEANPAGRALFLLAADGTRQVQVSDGTARDRVVGWAPGGSALWFLSDRTGATELWSLPLVAGRVSGTATLLKGELDGMWPLGVTARGDIVYVNYRTTGSAFTASVDWVSGLVSDETRISRGVTADFVPDWSPDGEHLAFVAHRGSAMSRRFLVVQPRAGGAAVEVMPSDDMEIFVTGGFRWSPDGRSFLVTGRTATEPQGAFAIDVTTGRAQALASRPGAQVTAPQWIRGGTSVLYTLGGGLQPAGQLFVRSLADGTDQPLRHGFEGDRYVTASASPDERLLAVQTGAPDGAPALHVMPMAGGPARRLVDVPVSRWGWVIGWTRDSKRIIYGTQDKATGQIEPGSQVWSVPVDGGEPVRVRFERRVNDLRVHPDNRRVAYQVGGTDREVWQLTGLVSAAQASR